ncbi:MAG: DoxX family protein [Nitrospinota bacterium]
MSTKDKSVWFCQLLAASILLYASFEKFSGDLESLEIFTKLGMEPVGRYIIATIEFLSSMALLTTSFSAVGALFGIGTMLGAMIAHVTTLGMVMNNDNGVHVMMLFLVLASCTVTLWTRRKTLPIIGPTL